MKKVLFRGIIFLHERKQPVYNFLKENGFFEEIVRGTVKFIFFLIILCCFKQVVWWSGVTDGIEPDTSIFPSQAHYSHIINIHNIEHYLV